MSKLALICGISGQDGTYLAKLLLDRGYEVWGSSRDAELATFDNLRRLGIYDSVRLVSLNLRDVGSVLSLLRRIRPDQIFSLAGQSSVGLSFEQPVETIESIALGALSLLEAIRLSDLDIRLYNAGSTECFGDTGDAVANEKSPLNPCSPYAVAKASAYWTVANYRQAYGMLPALESFPTMTLLYGRGGSSRERSSTQWRLWPWVAMCVYRLATCILKGLGLGAGICRSNCDNVGSAFSRRLHHRHGNQSYVATVHGSSL